MKQVIVVDESLKLPKGKLAAQVAHAWVTVFIDATQATRKAWIDCGVPKIVLQCADESDGP